jgi:hypothetical protein
VGAALAGGPGRRGKPAVVGQYFARQHQELALNPDRFILGRLGFECKEMFAKKSLQF